MLINCAAYENGRKLADIARNEISEYLKRPGCFVWVALYEPELGELEAMQEEFGLHELAVDDAQTGHQRPKIEEYGDSLFVVLHTVELEGKELRVGEVDVFAGANYILTVRHRTKRGFADVRARCEREPELLRHGSGFVLYALMDAVVDRYFPVVEALETEFESIEDQIFGGGLARQNIESLYALKQKLMILKHAAGPLLDSVGKLYGGRVPQVCVGTQEYFRDVYDHLSRINQTIDTIRDSVTTAMAVSLSLIQLQNSEMTKRLASYAALVAVPTMIAGVYGMNFEHMPELKWTFGYPLAVGAMVAIDAWLFYKFRKAGWL
ncbi:MAG TPA: magnesium/cobalt transporter CorA [Burkholderiales bacterium]|nr:magnesium/cobalt transporter CorA [Burkholderiales bacterium]